MSFKEWARFLQSLPSIPIVIDRSTRTAIEQEAEKLSCDELLRRLRDQKRIKRLMQLCDEVFTEIYREKMGGRLEFGEFGDKREEMPQVEDRIKVLLEVEIDEEEASSNWRLQLTELPKWGPVWIKAARILDKEQEGWRSGSRNGNRRKA